METPQEPKDEFEACIWEEEDGVRYAHLHDPETGKEFKLRVVSYESLDQ
ncbi:hypothetical protein [Medusavirus stheno T3]|uniref:Uncharacterized protein n=1 Tax=Medusavirus stheno T3 TaxID=3069717 RepID=A0A7S7YES8_9VIRU|nr:hypothetical protein QKU73_gp301 [Acanthamoeba castellanii medusavirus]QPB44474.1 hypothetical protein [Medusavirus stheno T3]